MKEGLLKGGNWLIWREGRVEGVILLRESNDMGINVGEYDQIVMIIECFEILI